MPQTFKIILLALSVLLWIAYCLSYIWHKIFSDHGIPKNITWPGDANEFWSRGKATIRSFFGTQDILEDGYEKYSKNERPFVLPNLMFGPEIIVPASQTQWLLEQSEEVLSQDEANNRTISGDITLLDPEIMANKIHKQILENELSKRQDDFADDQINEVQYTLDLSWGTDSQAWKEVAVFDFFADCMTRMVARTFVGGRLCRDATYLHSAGRFNAYIPLVAYIHQLSVPVLQPLMVRLAHMYDRMLYRRIRRMVLPIIAERVPSFHDRKLLSRNSKIRIPGDAGPNDFIQWALKYAFSDNSFDPNRTPELITKQLAVMSFASTQSTALSLTNILFDIASHPDSISIQNILHDEITQVISQQKEHHPEAKEFGRANLSQMVHLDSAIRESLRRWGFSTRGIQKAVIAPEGVTLPSGEHVPHGVLVGISTWTTHHDPSNYSNPNEYRPFRFSDNDNLAEIENLYGKGKVPAGGATMTSTGDRYLVFSHGRWACPGRFFAQNNLKRVIAQIILRYDIEPIVVRPKNVWFNNLIGPPMTEKVRVRRRA